MALRPLSRAFCSAMVRAIPAIPPAAALLKLSAPGVMVLWGDGRWAAGGYEVPWPQDRLSVSRCGDERSGGTESPYPLGVAPAAYWPLPRPRFAGSWL